MQSKWIRFCRKNRLIVSFLSMAAALTGAALYGQTFQAQVTGTVRDSTAAIIPEAQLKAVNLATRTEYSARSNGEGVYVLPSLMPGEYTITCSVIGFRRFEQSHMTLQVGDVIELNITLQPGDASDQVTVSATPPAIETSNASLGQVVTTRSVESLPLNVRSSMALVGLTPGVVFASAAGYDSSASAAGRNFMKSDFNVGGGVAYFQEILVDGAPNTTPDYGYGIIDPPVDSLQEFKVQPNSYDAQFGRSTGGIVSMVTKSGSNVYHGVVYDFERHSVLDANNFFSNLGGQKRLSFQRHQAGGNIGGPVLKNKWFLFGDFETLRQAYPTTTVSTVPTALQRQGNFSQTLASSGSVVTVYDPSTLSSSNGTQQRSPFPGNVIPSSRFDTVANNSIPYFPLPNGAGTAITDQNNYVYSANSITNTNKYDIRSDTNFSDNTRMFARFSRQTDTRLTPGPIPEPGGGANTNFDHYEQAVWDFTHVVSPSLVADMQVSYSRALAIQFGTSRGNVNLVKLGFPSSYAAVMDEQFPNYVINDSLTTPGNGVQSQPRNVYVAHGSLGYLRGKHNFKFGAEWRGLHFNEGQWSTAGGSYTFSRMFTQGPNPLVSSATAGHGFASFLLGDASSGNVTQMEPISTEASYYAAFVQDDWRITDRLTLNLGLRWDVQIGDKEKYDRLAYLDLSAPNPLGPPAGLPNLTGLVRWIGQGNSSTQQKTAWTDFGPRVGLAYQLSHRTVVRMGYGILYAPPRVAGKGFGALETNPLTPLVTTIDGVTPANTLSNPFPQGIQLAQNDRNPLVDVGSQVVAPTLDFKPAYVQTWNVALQKELPWGIVTSLNYWGNKGTHLITGPWNVNQLPDQYLSLGTKLNTLVPNPFYGLIPTGALSGPTVSLRQTLLPYPQYSTDSGIQTIFVPAGNDIYHAVSLQAERRMSTSLTFLALYTIAKSIDDMGTPQDIYNRKLLRDISALDTPRQLQLSGVYQIPFGRGRKYGVDWNPLVKTLLGGWDVDTIIIFQSGLPVAIALPAVNTGQSGHLDNPTIYKWFNTSAFTPAAPFTFGSLGGPRLPDVRADGLHNVDAVLGRMFSVSVRDRPITVQFRAEFFNLFNTPQFSAPNGSVSSQSFGVVSAQYNNPREIQFGLKIKF